MTGRPDPDRTVDDALDAGLAAAFGPDSGPPPPAAASVLKALGAPHLVLRDPHGEAAEPIVKPCSDAMPRAPADPAARYRIDGEIARGGMGAVLKGRDTDLGRDVAVKVLLETHAGKTELLQRFVEEAQIAGQLQHPSVVPVYDIGQFPDRRPYFTMKLVKGQTLAKLLAERKDPSQDRPRFLGIFLQVCQALAYAHARGVIHRDLKPSNVMVGAFGEVQVMDWGLAKVLPQGGVADEGRGRGRQGAEPASAIHTARARGAGTPGGAGSDTREGSVMGTPAYMAPEQARGEVGCVDERADVFGLGAILCEVLTGDPPYAAGEGTEVYRRATRADLADALARLDRCGADPELIALARGCLAAAPADRPRDAGALAAKLTEYLESVEARLRRAEVERARAAVQAAEERKRRRLAVGLAAAVLALVLVGGGGAVWVAQDRAARRADEAARAREVERGASAELGRAAELREQARRKPGGDRDLAAAALAAARRAEGMLANGGADDDLRRRAEALVAELQDEEHDRRMLARLREARLHTAGGNRRVGGGGDAFFDDAAAEPLFAAAFRDYGTDVDRLPFAEAAGRLAGRAIRAELAAGLDDWARAKTADADRRKLRDLARAVDDDDTRNRVRDARQRDDVPAMTALAAAPGSDVLPPSTVVLLARDLRWAGGAAAAADLLRRAVRRYPDDFWVNHELALALKQLPSPPWDDVVRYNSIAAALLPRSPGAYLNLGHSFLDSGRPDEAVAAYEKALELDPDFVLAHTWLGSARVRQGRPDDAVRACRQAIALRPTVYQAHNILGDALRIQGRAKESLAACEEAIRLKPDFAEAHNNRGNAFQLLDRPDDAVAAYREAIRLDPQFAAAASANLGILLERRGDAAGAVVALRKAIALPAHGSDKPDLAQVWFHLAGAFNQQGRRADAADALRHAIELRPNEAMSHYNLGIALEALDRPDEALAAYRRSAALQADHAESHLNVGGLLAGKGQWDEAIASFRKALAIRKDYAKAHNNLAYALRKKGRADEAIASAREAVKVQPDYAEAHVNLGLALSEKGDFAAALEELRRGDALGAKVAGWSLPSARWVRECERLAELDRKLSAAFADPPAPADADDWVGLAYFAHIQKRRYAAATRLWERAFQAKPALAAAGGSHCYSAACAAALAGGGQGEDATRASAAERTRWRKQALEWLRGELAAWDKVFQSVPARVYPAVQQELRHWQQDADLASLRDPVAVSKLPGDEQGAWKTLWADVEALLKKAQEKK